MNYPTRNPSSIRSQSGAVMLLTVVLLLTVTIMGVAAFHNAHIQERNAGNLRLQSLAFEAAAAGAINSVNFYDTQRELTPDLECGSFDHVGWADTTDWVNVGSFGGATLSQRMYCLADIYPCEDEETCDDVRPARSQLFVLSRGEIMAGEDVVASRDIEVRLGVIGGGDSGGGGSCGAICLPGCTAGNHVFPNSNAFRVDGAGGPAMTGGCETQQLSILNAIRDNRLGNYIGNIQVAEHDETSPWYSPATAEALRVQVELSALAAEVNPDFNCMAFCHSATGVVDNGNTEYGTSENPQITYINGDADMGGNVSGAGILFVNGNVSWNGTPQFDGLIVVMGDQFYIDGSGNGGDFAGSLVILGATNPVDGDFAASSFDNTGGGTGDYIYDCDALVRASQLLNTAGQEIYSPTCNGGGENYYNAETSAINIVSWRENVGWREAMFIGAVEEGGGGGGGEGTPSTN